MESLASQAEWAARNIAYNLDFFPADKLSYKPAPTANSAYEIIGHTVAALGFFRKTVKGEDPGTPGSLEMTNPTTLEEAKEMLVSSADAYGAALRGMSPEDAGKIIEMQFAKLPLGFVASMAVTDLIHHHGQIAYIQTILGDTESHFDMSLLPQS